MMQQQLIDECLHAIVEALSKNEFASNFKCDLAPQDRKTLTHWTAGKSPLELMDALSRLLPARQAADKQSGVKNQIESIIQRLDAKPMFPSDKRAELYEVIEFLESKRQSSSMPEGIVSVLDQLKQNAEAVVMVVRADSLKEYGKSGCSYTLESYPLDSRRIHHNNFKISRDSKFLQQRSANLLGTGFFIEDHLIATAAHILYPPFENLQLSELRFVKGVFIHKEKSFQTRIVVQKADVYKVDPAKTPEFELTSIGPDWALIPVVPATEEAQAINSPCVVGYSDEVYDQQKLYALGHGLGLPLKVSPNGIVHVNDQNKDYFKCKMELLSGNSGSPIFDAQTHKVVGILVRGQPDFIATRNQAGGDSIYCLSLNNYSNTYTGEECQRMGPVMERLQNFQSIHRPVEQTVFENI